MRALVVTRRGGPDVLQLKERTLPAPTGDELRIDVHFAGLNFADISARVGLYLDAPPLPAVLGYEVAGVVSAVGGRCGLRVGERVMALTRFGGQATQVVVPERQAFRVPENVSLEQAAALPVNYLTAFHLLHHMTPLRSGCRLLIHAAAGGVGLAAVQLARRVPGVELFGTASATKHALLRSEGVQHPIDYRSEDYAERVRQLTAGRGVDIVLNPLGGRDWRRSYALLAPGGHMACYGFSNLVEGSRRNLLHVLWALLTMPRFSPAGLMAANRAVSGLNIGALWNETALLRGGMEELLALLAAKEISPHVDLVVPLAQGAEAHRRLESRSNVGKVLFDCRT